MRGCSPDPAPKIKVVGNIAAVDGWPHQPSGGRLLIENCCTLRLAPDARSIPGQGIDTVAHDVSGPGYVLHIAFGPHNTGNPPIGYKPEGKRIIDGVELTAFRWPDGQHAPPQGQLLWLAQVGGKIIQGVEHAPWDLKIWANCASVSACNASATLVDTIRF